MGEITLWITVIFLTGSILVMERRCLGQRALVQPLTLCLLAGWLVDDVEVGLWLGVTLQLFSVTPNRSVDWGLAGAITAITLVAAARLDATFSMGSTESSVLLLVAVLLGVVCRKVESSFARADTKIILTRSPWTEPNPERAVERTVYRAIGRWILLSGLQVTSGVGLSIACMLGATFLDPPPAWLQTVSTVAMPTFGVAVALSALAQTRLIAWSGVSMGLSFLLAWVVLLT